MNILVINPPNKPFTERSLLIEPIDVLGIASYLQQIKNKVKVVDMDVKKMSSHDLKPIITKFKPKLVVIPFDYHIALHTSKTIIEIKKIIKLIKKINEKTFIVVGGKTPKHYPTIFLEAGADIVANSEMELTLKDLINKKFKKLNLIKGISYTDSGKLKINKSPVKKIKLDKLPITNRKLVDLNDYIDVRTILTSRGCNGNCGFCATPDFWGCWQGKSPKKVVDEIQNVVSKHNAQKILFLDDNATVSNTRLKEISKEIIKRKLNYVKYGCLGRIASFDENTMKLMRKAGFRWIHYGAEFASKKVLDGLRKGITPLDIEKVVMKTKKLGFRVRTSWIFDLPEADEKGLKRSVDMILKIQPQEIRAHFLSLRVGSDYHKETKKRKGIESQYIHNKKPNKSVKRKLSLRKINSEMKRLVKGLKKEGYLVVKDVRDWRNVEKLRKKDPELKFISFCPSRYGVNW